MKRSIYLCGPINGCTDAEANDWRTKVKTLWNGDIIDPMRRDYRGMEQTKFREIVENDKLDVAIADGILVSFGKIDSPMVGTSMEILYAWERGKPCVVVIPTTYDPSPWLVYHASKIVYTYEEAVEYLTHELITAEELI